MQTMKPTWLTWQKGNLLENQYGTHGSSKKVRDTEPGKQRGVKRGQVAKNTSRVTPRDGLVTKPLLVSPPLDSPSEQPKLPVGHLAVLHLCQACKSQGGVSDCPV